MYTVSSANTTAMSRLSTSWYHLSIRIVYVSVWNHMEMFQPWSFSRRALVDAVQNALELFILPHVLGRGSYEAIVLVVLIYPKLITFS